MELLAQQMRMTQEAEDDRKAKLKVGSQTHHSFSMACSSVVTFCTLLATLRTSLATFFFVSCDALYFGRYTLYCHVSSSSAR
jgi:hypothetical protein